MAEIFDVLKLFVLDFFLYKYLVFQFITKIIMIVGRIRTEGSLFSPRNFARYGLAGLEMPEAKVLKEPSRLRIA